MWGCRPDRYLVIGRQGGKVAAREEDGGWEGCVLWEEDGGWEGCVLWEEGDQGEGCVWGRGVAQGLLIVGVLVTVRGNSLLLSSLLGC